LSNVAANPASDSGPRNPSGTPTWWIVTSVLSPTTAKVIVAVISSIVLVFGCAHPFAYFVWTCSRCASRASRRYSQRRFCSVIQLMSSSAVSVSIRQGRRWASTPWLMSPALWRTLMCLETACRLIVNGSASSFTLASPSERRVKIARRVGSAKAEKAASSRSSVSVTSYEGRQRNRK
jgi:hypothetical protein